MTRHDMTAGEAGRTDRAAMRAGELLAAENPVPGDAFSGSWSEPRWQAELERILASPRPQDGSTRGPARPPRRHRPRRHWRLAGLTAVGVAAAVTAAVVFAVPGPQPATPPRGPAPGVFGWPSGQPGTSPGEPAGARNVLLAVAGAVAHRPAPTVGAYWRTKTEYGVVRPAGPPLGGRQYMIVERGRQSGWQARTGSRPSSLTVQWLGVQLASPADAAAWRRAGSPTTWAAPPAAGPADPQGFASANAGPTHAAPGKPTVEFGGTGPSSLTYDGKPLSALPADPALLRTLLARGYRPSGVGGGISGWLFWNAQDLLTDPVTPAVRSAVYRMLAALPGAVNLGTVRDISGRSGTGIALDTRYPRCLENTGLGAQRAANPPTAPCTVQQRLIINPSTGMPLASELRYVSPPGAERWPVPGGLFSYEIVLGSGWTNRAPPAR